MRFYILFTLSLLVGMMPSQAQQRTVDEVKKSIDDLTASLKTYQSALSKIKPALAEESTKSRAETWWVAGRTAFGIYEKHRVNQSVGNTVNIAEMGHSLIESYNYCTQALMLDTIKETNKDGSFKTDKRTGKQKFKTKFSKDIKNRLLELMIDFGASGGDLYKVKDYKGAFQAWEIYYTIATSHYAKEKHKIEADSVIGLMRFYQGLAAHQLNKHEIAHNLFNEARQRGYKKKIVFDNDLNALKQLNDTISMVKTAKEAFSLYGRQDIRYMRILINDCIARKNYKEAEVMLDQAVMQDSTNANYFDLRGNIVELQSGYQEARPYYQHAVEINEESAQSQFDLGRCYYMEALAYTKDNSKLSEKKLLKAVRPVYEKALLHLEKAYSLNSQNNDARIILMDIYYKLGEGEKLDKLEHQQ